MPCFNNNDNNSYIIRAKIVSEINKEKNQNFIRLTNHIKEISVHQIYPVISEVPSVFICL